MLRGVKATHQFQKVFQVKHRADFLLEKLAVCISIMSLLLKVPDKALKDILIFFCVLIAQYKFFYVCV